MLRKGERNEVKFLAFPEHEVFSAVRALWGRGAFHGLLSGRCLTIHVAYFLDGEVAGVPFGLGERNEKA